MTITIDMGIKRICIFLCVVIGGMTGVSMLGWFAPRVLFAVVAVALGVIGVELYMQYVRARKKISFRIDRFDAFMLCCVVVLGIFHAFFAHSIPQGRDDSVYLTSAIKISESHSLKFEDELVAPYHGFRSVGDTSQHFFTSQFLPLYSVYLAMWHLAFGLQGIFAANGLLIALGLYCLYKTIALSTTKKAGLVTIMLFTTSYTMFWFPRRTLSENLVFFLFWCATMFFVDGFRWHRFRSIAIGFMPIALLLLLRGEGIGFAGSYLAATAIALKIDPELRKNAMKQWLWSALALLFSIGSGVLLVLYGAWFGSPYLESGLEEATSAGLNPAVIIGGIVVAGLILTYLFTPKEKKQVFLKRAIGLGALAIIIGEIILLLYLHAKDRVTWSAYEQQVVVKQLASYGILFFAGLAVIAWYKNLFNKTIAFVVLISLPSFIFLVHPSIAVDQPWFMRRFFPIFIPLIYSLAAIALTSWIKKEKLFIALLMISVPQLAIAYPLINFKEHQGVETAFSKFASQFEQGDLILTEPGWRWQQWAYGLHFVNHLNVLPSNENLSPEEVSRIISSHKRVFLLTSYQSSTLTDVTSLSNLTRLAEKDLVLNNLPALSTIRWTTPYVDNNHRELSISYLETGFYDVPPRTVRLVNERYDVYEIKDPNQITFMIR